MANKPNKQRVNITSDIYGGKKQDVLEKMISPNRPQETVSDQEQPAPNPSTNTAIPQSDNNSLSQNVNNAMPQKIRKSDERERKTFYLEQHHFDKLDELRRQYKKTTKKRINEQEIVRLLIERAELESIL